MFNFIKLIGAYIEKGVIKTLFLCGLVGRPYYNHIREKHGLSRSEYHANKEQNDKSKMKAYIDWCQNHMNDLSGFTPLSDTHYTRDENDPKLIAYYLPQFYEFEQNNLWHGKGFTEWTNTTKSVPQFTGHYQPRIPIDVGYYNLNTSDAMRRQIELAKQYGIYGFCFYYYWFHGDRIMEKPIFNLLDDKSLDMPFMLFWANENWTKNWVADAKYGEIGEKVYDAFHAPEEAAAFLDGILPFWNDSRYIRIGGAPALIIYRHNADAYTREFVDELRAECRRRKISEPHIIMITDYQIDKGLDFNPYEFGGDAIGEFATNSIKPKRKLQVSMNKKAHLGHRDMADYIANKRYEYDTEYPLYRGVMTSYDNTARKVYTDATIFIVSADEYKTWLKDSIDYMKNKSTAPEKLLFVAAWNEWAEAMCLEPCKKYGYTYLQKTREAIEESRDE